MIIRNFSHKFRYYWAQEGFLILHYLNSINPWWLTTANPNKTSQPAWNRHASILIIIGSAENRCGLIRKASGKARTKTFGLQEMSPKLFQLCKLYKGKDANTWKQLMLHILRRNWINSRIILTLHDGIHTTEADSLWE